MPGKLQSTDTSFYIQLRFLERSRRSGHNSYLVKRAGEHLTDQSLGEKTSALSVFEALCAIRSMNNSHKTASMNIFSLNFFKVMQEVKDAYEAI